MSDNLKKRIYDEYFEGLFTTRDAWIENTLRKNAVPPIKGEITPGKIKWRGISMKKITARDGDVEVAGEYILQRGKLLGPMFLSDKVSYVN